jgi:hypothetical protein
VSNNKWEENKMAEWTIDPSKFVQGTIDNIDKVRRIYAFEIFRRVVERTPVHNDDYTKRGKKRKKQYPGGATRQNWLVTLNNEDTSYDPNKKKGGRVMSNGKKVIESAKGDDTIILQLNTPNANMLEYGGWPKNPKNGSYTINGLPKTVDGFSREAPKGMVGAALAQAEQLFQKAVIAVKGGGS